MNRVIVNTKYRMGYQLQWLLLALAIYITAITATFVPLIRLSLINENEGSLVYRMIFLVITLFAFSLRFKEDFDFFLTLGNRRKEIFLSMTVAAALLSVCISGLLILERVVVDGLNRAMSFHNIIDPFHFFSPYRTGGAFPQFFFFLSANIGLSTFGLFMGSLFYRWGRVFMTFFWVAATTIPLGVVSLILWISHRNGRLGETVSMWRTFLRSFDLWTAGTAFIVAALLIGTATYLNIRKLPQK